MYIYVYIERESSDIYIYIRVYIYIPIISPLYPPIFTALDFPPPRGPAQGGRQGCRPSSRCLWFLLLSRGPWPWGFHWAVQWDLCHDLLGFYSDSMGYSWDIASGNLFPWP